MHQSFKPLRRKIGVATLAVTCLCATGWVSSFYSIAGLQFPGQNSDEQILSDRSKLVWISDALSEADYQTYSETWDEWPKFQVFFGIPQVDYLRGWKQDWTFCGFDQHYRNRPDLEDRCLRVPYWFIVLPLTLLSAWLLLSKSEQSKPTSEPDV